MKGYAVIFFIALVAALHGAPAFPEEISSNEKSTFTLQEQAEMKELVLRIRRGITNSALKLGAILEEKGRYKEAQRWYHHAFIQDNGSAGFALYHLHRQGYISLKYPDNIRKLSLHMMEQAAYQGDDSSALKLGLTYLKGDYIPPNYEKAVLFLELARSEGKAMASYHLGNIYSNGLFAAIQSRKALGYYEEASERGIAEATRQLGLAYLTDIYYPRDTGQAILLLEKSIQQGSMEAMRDLANLYRYDEHDMHKYVYWMQKAAIAGNSDAQYYMGLHYEMQAPLKAREYFMAAAQQGHFMAQQNLPDEEKASQ